MFTMLLELQRLGIIEEGYTVDMCDEVERD
jgi:hypothetical protein